MGEPPPNLKMQMPQHKAALNFSQSSFATAKDSSAIKPFDY